MLVSATDVTYAVCVQHDGDPATEERELTSTLSTRADAMMVASLAVLANRPSKRRNAFARVYRVEGLVSEKRALLAVVERRASDDNLVTVHEPAGVTAQQVPAAILIPRRD